MTRVTTKRGSASRSTARGTANLDTPNRNTPSRVNGRHRTAAAVPARKLATARTADPARKPTTASAADPDEVHERIWSAIMDHSLPPETRLVEERLCEIFGLGRTRLRQVLQRLAHENVVT